VRSLGLRQAFVRLGHDTQGPPAAPNEKAHAGLASRRGWAANFGA